MENLPPLTSDRQWEILNSASAEEFGTVELKALKLVVSYCCYFSHGSSTPSPEYRASSRKGYYSLAKEIAEKGKLSSGNAKVSSIIRDKTMAQIIRIMEK